VYAYGSRVCGVSTPLGILLVDKWSWWFGILRDIVFLPPLGILAGVLLVAVTIFLFVGFLPPLGILTTYNIVPELGCVGSFYPLWGFSAHVFGSCGFISFSLIFVGTARRF